MSPNTGVREKVICSLRWEWEVKVPQLGVSVFVVPRQNVKGRKRERIIVCNSVAQSVVESMRGKHAECVFVWRRERVKSPDPAKMGYRPIATMNNTGWQTARKAVGLADVHVHDLRHTVGMRLREAGVQAETISDILWHSSPTMTHHYSVAQIAELHGALERITTEPDGWNRSLSSLRAEQGVHPKLTRLFVGLFVQLVEDALKPFLNLSVKAGKLTARGVVLGDVQPMRRDGRLKLFQISHHAAHVPRQTGN